MTTRYQDAWLRQQAAWHDDPDRFTVHTPTDPAHGDKSEATLPLMMDAPVLQTGGEIYTDAVFENYDWLGQSVPIDTTPVGGQGTPEESGHGYGGLFRPSATEAELGGIRGRDVGAHKRETQSPPTYWMAHEKPFSTHTKGFDPPPITQGVGDAVLRRGLNAYPENDGPSGRPWAWTVNPESWRRGDYEGSNIQRDFTPPNRIHGEFKMVEADIVTIVGDVPPPDKPDVYASPFSSLQRFMPRRRKPRGIRRDPGPWDEDLLTAPVGQMPLASVDGMTVN